MSTDIFSRVYLKLNVRDTIDLYYSCQNYFNIYIEVPNFILPNLLMFRFVKVLQVSGVAL